MCSRYAFVPESHAWGDLRATLGALADELLALPARPKLAPTDPVPIVVQQPGAPPQLVQARWRFIPHWWTKAELPRLTFNARSEEAATKPMWRDALRRARCLIPATSWYEWQKAQGVKIPHTLRSEDGRAFMFAGLWSLWRSRAAAEAVATCVILTMPASPAVAHVHDRMPVVLAPDAWSAWLDPGMTEPARALEMLQRHAVRAVVAFTVDRH
jgi:putative SOS response-associated peptidase YedK